VHRAEFQEPFGDAQVVGDFEGAGLDGLGAGRRGGPRGLFDEADRHAAAGQVAGQRQAGGSGADDQYFGHVRFRQGYLT